MLAEGSGLSCVIPPPIKYQLKMEEQYYMPREHTPPFLSNAQLEPIYYACQSFEKYIDEGNSIRQGFLLGWFEFSIY